VPAPDHRLAPGVRYAGFGGSMELTGIEDTVHVFDTRQYTEYNAALRKESIEKAKLELAEMEMYAKAAQSDAENITDRWKADMSSDSWLSKNIRPMSLIAIFCGYFLFAMMSAFGYNANESYVTLLGNWGMLIMGAYFGGRTVEKLAEMRSSK
jgi:hypothetical protein